MPHNFDYVFVAYGLWVVTFVVYFAYLFRRSQKAQRALEKLKAGNRQAL